jgi:hypothetical protein
MSTIYFNDLKIKSAEFLPSAKFFKKEDSTAITRQEAEAYVKSQCDSKTLKVHQACKQYTHTYNLLEVISISSNKHSTKEVQFIPLKIYMYYLDFVLNRLAHFKKLLNTEEKPLVLRSHQTRVEIYNKLLNDIAP